MAFESNLGNIGPGHGDAVVLDINPAINRAAQANSLEYRSNLGRARLAAKQKKDADDAMQSELSKMSGQIAGDAGYLTTQVAKLRSEFNTRISEGLERKEHQDLNKLRAELNSINNLQVHGKTITDQVRSRFPDLQSKDYVNTSNYENAFRQNLNEDYDSFVKKQSPYSFNIDANRIQERALKDNRFDLYNPEEYGKSILAASKEKTLAQPEVIGGNNRTTISDPFYTVGKSGVYEQELDYNKIRTSLDSGKGTGIVNNRFQRTLNDPNSDYHRADVQNQQDFANDPSGYQTATLALRGKYVENEFRKDSRIVDENLKYSNTSNLIKANAGGRGKEPKEKVRGTGVMSEFVGMGSIIDPKKGTTAISPTIQSYPLMTSDSQIPNKTPFTSITHKNYISVKEDGKVEYGLPPLNSRADVANSRFISLPVLTKELVVNNFISRRGINIGTQKFPIGTIIGDGGFFSRANRSEIKRILEKAGPDVKQKFGALISVYDGQGKMPALTKDQIDEGLTAEIMYAANKGANKWGDIFVEKRVNDALYQQAWSKSKNLYEGMDADKMERDLNAQGKLSTESQHGVQPFQSKSAAFLKPTPQQKTVPQKSAVKMQY